MQKFIEKKISHNRKFVNQLKKFLKKIKYNPEHWIRYPTYKLIKEEILRLQPEKLNALEISAGEYWKNNYKFKSFEALNFPSHDICGNLELSKKYDLIIADNVWEHLKYPYRATRNVHSLLNDGGYFLIIVPFLVRIHKVPIDCTRWSPDGLKYFLHDCGFKFENIKIDSWGNKDCVISNLRKDDTWTRIGFHKNLKNDKDFPVQTWAIVKK